MSNGIARIRKLLMLARSSNTYEAESATGMARDLMDRLGLDVSIDDLDEAVAVVADSEGNYAREQIALLVAQTRGCTVGVLGKTIYIRGLRSAAENASRVYRKVVEVGHCGEGLSETDIASFFCAGRNVVIREVYQRVYWLHFVATLDARYKKRPCKRKQEKESEAALRAARGAAQAAGRLSYNHAARARDEVEGVRALQMDIGLTVAGKIDAIAKARGTLQATQAKISRWRPPRLVKKRPPKVVVRGLLPEFCLRDWEVDLDLPMIGLLVPRSPPSP